MSNYRSQGFKNHQLHDVLESPGSADLTADVDFAAVRRAALSEGEITLMYFDQRLRLWAAAEPTRTNCARNIIIKPTKHSHDGSPIVLRQL